MNKDNLHIINDTDLKHDYNEYDAYVEWLVNVIDRNKDGEFILSTSCLRGYKYAMMYKGKIVLKLKGAGNYKSHRRGFME